MNIKPRRQILSVCKALSQRLVRFSQIRNVKLYVPDERFQMRFRKCKPQSRVFLNLMII